MVLIRLPYVRELPEFTTFRPNGLKNWISDERP
jgi:hypothetical protein